MMPGAAAITAPSDRLDAWLESTRMLPLKETTSRVSGRLKSPSLIFFIFFTVSRHGQSCLASSPSSFRLTQRRLNRGWISKVLFFWGSGFSSSSGPTCFLQGLVLAKARKGMERCSWAARERMSFPLLGEKLATQRLPMKSTVKVLTLTAPSNSWSGARQKFLVRINR